MKRRNFLKTVVVTPAVLKASDKQPVLPPLTHTGRDCYDDPPLKEDELRFVNGVCDSHTPHLTKAGLTSLARGQGVSFNKVQFLLGDDVMVTYDLGHSIYLNTEDEVNITGLKLALPK